MIEEIKQFYNSVRDIQQGTYNKFRGMYIGEQNNPSCKQNRNILITMVPTSNYNDTITITRGVYKRNYLKHKKGDLRQVKILRKVPSNLTPNIQAAWQMVYDYPTVSYGLSAFRRDVLIIDSDAYYESLDKAKEIIAKFTKKSKLPEISYILRNPTSGHIQCGWFLDTPFEAYERRHFNQIINGLAVMYQKATGNDGDICFHGPACKNPFFEGFESYVSYNVANKQSIVETVESFIKFIERTNLYLNTSSSSSLYNITNVTVNQLDNQMDRQMESTTEQTVETTVETTEQTDKQNKEHFEINKHLTKEEKIYTTWEQFKESQLVWNQLKRQPKFTDWVKYTQHKLNIREVA